MVEYDLISKTALLRHLDMAIDCKDCPRNTDRKTYYERCACSEVADICNTITDFATFVDVQPINQWISVKERLPETNAIGIAHILAYDRCEGVVKADFFDESANYTKGSNIFEISNTSAQLHKVTHWQPLPESPKDGDTE